MNIAARTAAVYSRSRPYFKHGVGHLLMYTLGRFQFVRSCMVWIYSQGRTSQTLSSDQGSQIEDVNVAEAARSIAQDGFFSGLRLRSEVLEQLLAFAKTAICFGNSETDKPFIYGDKESAQLRHTQTFRLGMYNHAFLVSPLLRKLVSDPQLLAIARKYLSAEPAVIGARMWWSFACPATVEEQMKSGQGFHFDLDGYRSISFFFYLTDVGPSNGAHVYVRGSHIKKSLRHTLSLFKGRTDSEIEKYYGLERQVVSCGPAGCGFAEDTFGFHKGLHPESGDRLIVQVRYGLRDYGTGRND